jgi:VIT1/CCC1 family predicted Fe2+/Mn2+ transporter
VKADWIEICVDAAQQATSDADQVVAERLKAELETRLSIRGLRPKELGELADQLMSLLSVAPIASDTDSADADRHDLP